MKPLYSRAMNEAFFTDLSTWLTQAGLAGTPEIDIVSGCCDRCVAAGLPLGRTQVFIDTLHPVHEGRLFRWGFGRGETLPPRLRPCFCGTLRVARCVTATGAVYA